ncbi:mechanosensitive ion channel [Fragilaria crotonensis]|nr:mechanosensitive ion channel [Fragilaria crotonensis]
MASLPSRTLNRQGGMLAFDEEQEAEGALVSNLEVRRANATKKNDWDAAVDGEVPPLERVPIADSTFFPMSQVAKGVPDMFTSIAKQFNITKGVKALKKTGTLGFTRRMPSVKDHVEGRKDGKPDVFTSFRVEKGDGKFNSHMDNLVASAIKVNQLFENDAYNSNGNEADTYDETQSHSYVFARDDTTEPLLPVTSPGADQYSYSYGSAGSVIGLKRQKKKKRAIESVATSQFWCLPRSRFGLAEILNPVTCMRGMFRFLFASTLPFVILPSVLVASLLYFQMGNPSVEFLPGDASLSWWLIFIARQALVLELVVVVEYLAVEGIALRTKWMVYSCGPLVTLWFINAKG